MPTELTVTARSTPIAARLIPAYSGSVPHEMFILVIFRCPSCGSVGEAESWCSMHSAPMECVDSSLRVKREPVLVPHADTDSPVTETYESEESNG